jgi:hypothetical protein
MTPFSLRAVHGQATLRETGSILRKTNGSAG